MYYTGIPSYTSRHLLRVVIKQKKGDFICSALIIVKEMAFQKHAFMDPGRLPLNI